MCTLSFVKNPKLTRSIITSISLGTSIAGGTKLLSFILKILVSRLGVINFSDYYLSTSTFSGLTTITALGIPMSTTRYVSFFLGKNKSKEARDIIMSALTIVLISSSVVAIALYVGAQALANRVGTPHAAIYFRILSFGLTGATITILARAVFLGYLRIRLAYATEAVEVSVKFIFTLGGLLFLQWGVIGAIIRYTTGTLLASFINIAVLLRTSHIKRLSPKFEIKFLKFALPVSASEIITAATSIFFIYAVRSHSGAETIGYYGAALSLASLIHIVPQMVFSIFLPIASASFAKKHVIGPIYKTLLLWLSIVVLTPTVILYMTSPKLISIVFGQSYALAAPILSILAIAYGLYAIFVWPNRQVLDMAGFTQENCLLTIFRVIVTITSLYLLFPEFDGISLAKATLIGWIGEAIGSLLLVKQKQLI